MPGHLNETDIDRISKSNFVAREWCHQLTSSRRELVALSWKTRSDKFGTNSFESEKNVWHPSNPAKTKPVWTGGGLQHVQSPPPHWFPSDNKGTCRSIMWSMDESSNCHNFINSWLILNSLILNQILKGWRRPHNKVEANASKSLKNSCKLKP